MYGNGVKDNTMNTPNNSQLRHDITDAHIQL